MYKSVFQSEKLILEYFEFWKNILEPIRRFLRIFAFYSHRRIRRNFLTDSVQIERAVLNFILSIRDNFIIKFIKFLEKRRLLFYVKFSIRLNFFISYNRELQVNWTFYCVMQNRSSRDNERARALNKIPSGFRLFVRKRRRRICRRQSIPTEAHARHHGLGLDT